MSRHGRLLPLLPLLPLLLLLPLLPLLLLLPLPSAALMLHGVCVLIAGCHHRTLTLVAVAAVGVTAFCTRKVPARCHCKSACHTASAFSSVTLSIAQSDLIQTLALSLLTSQNFESKIPHE